MLSRLADNLYWHGRYLERAEDLARLVMVNTHLNLDLPAGLSAGWEPLVRITGKGPMFHARHDHAGEREVVHFLLADDDNPGSVKSALAMARENLRAARDLLPREVWEQMNGLYLNSRHKLSGSISRRGRDEYLRGLILSCQQIAGTLLGSMSHDHAYDFILIGRHIERADMITRILEVRGHDLLPEAPNDLTPYDSVQWMSVLKSLTAYQMYRRHVRMRVSGNDVLRFLLRDEAFPRSVTFCLDALEDLLDGLPGDDSRALDSVAGIRDTLAQTRVAGLRGRRLGELMDKLQSEIAGVDSAVRSTWFLDPAAAQASAT